MKKILFVVHALNIGGVGTVLTNIANVLIQRGHDVTIAVTSDKIVGAKNLVPQIKLIYKEEPEFTFFKKIPYIRNFFETGMWSVRRTPQQLYQYFVGKREKYDIEIAFFFGRPLKVVYGSNNIHSKKFLWVHSDYKYGPRKAYLSGFVREEDALAAYESFDYIVCVSNGVKKSFEEVIGRNEDIEVIYNINDVRKIRELSTQDTACKRNCFTFVYVGRLSSEKGVKRILEASRELQEDNFKFEVWIIGDGPEREKIENYVKQYELDSYVRILGAQENPYPYMREADVLVCPSECEAYGLTIAEAIILDTPVISTDCVGPRELLKDGKYGLLVSNSMQGVYEGMKNFLEQRETFAHYCQMANERKSLLEPEGIIDDIEKLF